VLFQQFTSGPFQTNSFLVYSVESNVAAMIDPATEQSSVIKFIEKYNLELKFILLTHAHLDHIGGVAWLQNKYHSKIMLHQEDASLLESAGEFARMLGLPAPRSFKPDVWLTEETDIQSGDFRLRVRHTPGHTPGSVCFINHDLAFVGDTLFAQSIGRTDLPGGDSSQILTSIQNQLFSLPETTRVFPGHGPDTTIQLEKATNPFF
jgi:glyoxylase-like metal-dependent hydrolase (beta-lactamase superfamily II)